MQDLFRQHNVENLKGVTSLSCLGVRCDGRVGIMLNIMSSCEILKNLKKNGNNKKVIKKEMKRGIGVGV